MSKIEWTEETWNPIAGCSLASPGCTNCYAMKTAWRFKDQVPKYAGTVKQVNGKPVWTGKINFDESALLVPLKRRKPTVWFVNSMSDLFHPDVPDAWIDKVFAVMALCPQHIFQVLTKRPERMREYLSREESPFLRIHFEASSDISGKKWGWIADHAPKGSAITQYNLHWQVKLPLLNVWLGTSVEDQKRADERIPDLLATPAAVRFLSCEPLLGPVDLTLLHHEDVTNIDALGGKHGVGPGFDHDCTKIDWVIVGGESGPGARPMHPDWARGLRDQCADARVPFFFKQWGEWRIAQHAPPDFAGASRMCAGDFFARIGKKAAGRLLDGMKHDAMPVSAGSAH